MNQSEFANLHGVSRKTVTKCKKRGWLVFQGNEVDAHQSNALLKKYCRDNVPVVPQSVTHAPQGNKHAAAPAVTDEVTIRPIESDEPCHRQTSQASQVFNAPGRRWRSVKQHRQSP